MSENAYSKDELAHFGIKGMKWGIWNDETKARYSGSRKRKRTKKDSGSEVKVKKKHPFLKGLAIAGALAGAGKIANDNGVSDKVYNKMNIDRDALWEPNQASGKDKPKQSRAEKIVKDFGKIPTESENIIEILDRSERNRLQRAIAEKAAKEVKNYSDTELRTKINRMNLEKQYATLKYGDIETGYESAMETLQTIGALVGITSAGVAIISTIHGLRK